MAPAETAVDEVHNPKDLGSRCRVGATGRGPQVHLVACLLEPEEDLAGVGAGDVEVSGLSGDISRPARALGISLAEMFAEVEQGRPKRWAK